MFQSIYIFIIIVFLQFSVEKTYVKNYFNNGQLKSEGWMINSQKDGYWFTYYDNGNKKEEGHFIKNKKSKWWIYYNTEEIIIKKAEFKNDVNHGFTIIYTNGNPVKGEQYKFGKKINQWNSLSEFKKDNFVAFIK